MTTPSAPVISAVNCSVGPPTLTLSVYWSQTGDYQGPYTIVVQDQSGNPVGPRPVVEGGTSGSWSGTNMSTTTSYAVVVQTSDATIFAGPVPFPSVPPAGLATSFDGTTATLTWKQPALGGDAPSAQLAIRNVAGFTQGFPPVPNVHCATATPAAGLFAASEELWAMVAMVLGTATGPYSPPVSLRRSTPAITAIKTGVAGGAATLSVMTPASGTGTASRSFIVGLYADGQLLYRSDPIVAAAPSGGQQVVAFPTAKVGWPLPGGARYAISLQETGGNSTGPTGLRQGYAARSPQATALTYALGGTGNPDLVTVQAAPPAGCGDVSGLYVALLDPAGGIASSTVATGFVAALPVTHAAAATGTIVIAAMIGAAVGPLASVTDPLIQAAPAIAAADYDGTAVTAQWAIVSSFTAYEMRLLANGVVIASGRIQAATGATTASGTITAVPGVTAVTVVALTGISEGPAAIAAPLVVTVPTLTGFGYAAGAMTAQYEFADTTLALEYRLMNDAAVVEHKVLAAGVKSVPLAAGSIAPGGELTLAARLVAGAFTGPWSMPAPLIATAPTQVTVDFDGTTARVAWAPLRAPVTGYRVQILHGATEAAAALTAGTTVSIDCTALPAQDDYAVLVTPIVGAFAGAPAAAVPLFGPGLYPAGGTTTPHLLPATVMSQPDTDLVILLPELFATPPTAMPAPQLLALTVLTPPQPPFKYALTITAGGGAWAFGQDPIRRTVLQQVRAFRAWVDTNNPLAGTVQLIDAAIGRAMPQTFAETLLYGAGASVAEGFIDLRPGHILQIGFEGYQNLGTSAAKYLNGFVGSSDAVYEVRSATGSDGRWLLGFDAYLSRFASYMSVPKPGATGSALAGGSGLADLYFDGFRQPYCRVVYPPSFLGQDGTGSAAAYYNIALVAAANLGDLDTATAALRNRGTDVGAAQLLYFRGRALVTVAHTVAVDGIAQRVPVGTTVGNLLEGLGARPPAMPLRLTGVTLRRTMAPLVATAAQAAAGVSPGATRPVRLDWRRDLSQAAGQDWLDLPVLAGDRLDIAPAGV